MTRGDFREERERMVEDQIVARGIRDPWVLQAMRTVPREEFVSARLQESAYDDGPLPIGEGQTISQPYAVALNLAIGGRLIMPVGSALRFQCLVRMTRTGAETYEREDLEEVAFVPLIGTQGWRDAKSAARPLEVR